MPFKWNQSSITVTCPKCQYQENVSVKDIEDSTTKIGAKYQHSVHIYWHCPVCDEEFEAEIEFIEYPKGNCESAEIIFGEDLLDEYKNSNLKSLVDFS